MLIISGAFSYFLLTILYKSIFIHQNVNFICIFRQKVVSLRRFLMVYLQKLPISLVLISNAKPSCDYAATN